MIKKEDLYNIRVECKDRNKEVLAVAKKYGFAEHRNEVFNSCKYISFLDDNLLAWGNHDNKLSDDFKYITVEELLELVKEEVKIYQVEESFIKEAHKAACSQWKAKLEEKFPEVFPKITYKAGQRFRYKDRDEYILCHVGSNKIAAFNLRDGGRWSEAVDVVSIYKITEDELKKILDLYYNKFKLIK